jgi:hypothetical protein
MTGPTSPDGDTTPYLFARPGWWVCLGWQHQNGETAFILARRNLLDEIRVLERYPLTEEGWAQAWRALASTGGEEAVRQVSASLAEPLRAPHTIPPRVRAQPPSMRPEDCPPNYRAWAITGMVVAVLLISIPGIAVGAYALHCSNQVATRWQARDPEGAEKYSDRARGWLIALTVLDALGVIVFLIILNNGASQP